MSKIIMLLDEMPDNCMDCIASIENWEEYIYHCQVMDNMEIPEDLKYGERPDWCPLKEIPEEMGGDYAVDDYDDGFNTGWNKCLRKIKGNS